MTVRLLADENVPRPTLRALRAAGMDIQAVSEIMPSAGDPEVLAYAASSGRWIVTFDRDYGELVFRNEAPAPPAILYLRQGNYPPEQPAEAILAAVAQPDFVTGHLVVIRGATMRRRALPNLQGA